MELKDQIEAYLMNRMSDIEKATFAAKIDSNPDLRKEVEEMQTLIMGIETANLKKKLALLAEGSEEGKVIKMDETQHRHGPLTLKEPKRLTIGWWAKAASILLLIGTAGWFLLRVSTPENDLFTQYYYADPGLQTTMGAASNFDFSDAMIDYKSKDYESAKRKWLKLLQISPTNDTLNYFIAAAHINSKDFDAAIPFLQKVIDQENSVFNHKAKWYWTLSQVQLQNMALIKEKWSSWNMLEIDNSQYPLDEFYKHVLVE